MSDNRKIISYITDLAFLAAIAAFAFWVNRDIVIKGLYMDDLYMWSCYGEQSLTEFVFPIGTSTRFRPVYWFATYLQMMIVGNHITRFVTFNVVVNIITAYLLYYIARRLSKSSIVSLIVGLCYLASRFAYYQIGQALGLMETMALFLAIAMLWQLYRYMESGKGYYAALIIYFLLVFTHERYLSLFPLIYLVIIMRMAGERRIRRNDAVSAVSKAAKCRDRDDSAGLSNLETVGTAGQHHTHEDGSNTHGSFAKQIKENWCKIALPLAELLLVIGIRCFAIGKALPAGTGGTEVTDTFSVGQAIGFCFDQIKYILGINAGPEYLNGLTWEDSPLYIRKLVYAGILLIIAVVLIYIVGIIGKRSKETMAEAARTALLFGGFIALCIGCSSVTIRLEMRWIYVSYAAALLYASYMIGSLKHAVGRRISDKMAADVTDEYAAAVKASTSKTEDITSSESRETMQREPAGTGRSLTDKKTAHIFSICAIIILTAYAVITIYVNIFYRGYYSRLYLWPNQLRMNSLAEQTVEKYGLDGILGKEIYIVGNSYEMSEFYADTFFKTFDPEMKAEGTEVIFVDSTDEVDTAALKSGDALVLKEVPEDNAYLDITEEVCVE